MFDTDKFRAEVSNFMLSSSHKAVLEYKSRYEKHDMRILKKTWIEYWNHLKKRNIWADGHFVQGTAFYLGIDIWIVSTKSKENIPYIKICSNLENPNTAGIAPPMIVGLKGDCHYQSLLPEENGKYFSQKKETFAEVVKKSINEKEMEHKNIKDTSKESDENQIAFNFLRSITVSEYDK